MPRVNVGQIWELIPGLQVLVLSVWSPDDTGDDLRIAPISSIGERRSAMAERDVRIEAVVRGALVPSVAHAWLAQSISSTCLRELIGEVSQGSLSAVLNAELIGLVAGAELKDVELRGAPMQGTNDARVTGMRALLAEVSERLAECHAALDEALWLNYERSRASMTAPLKFSSDVMPQVFFDLEALSKIIATAAEVGSASEAAGAFARAA